MNSEVADLPVSVVIPTFLREQVLVDTIGYLLALHDRAKEILVVDQSPTRDEAVAGTLAAWDREGEIRWLRQSLPSIPKAMNCGLLEAHHEIVLFVDDDIIPDAKLVAAHARAHREQAGRIVAGRVLQPWHGGQPDPQDKDPFGFNALAPREVTEFMGGNFSLSRDAAIETGGFDESFVRVAYRFEAEFAHRWRRSGRSIRYEPAALIHHLKIVSGGTRTFGEHLTTARPGHSVGAYYFFLRTEGVGAMGGILKRMLGSVKTRHHLKKPWWIPVTLLSELGGFGWAVWLVLSGPRYVGSETGGKRDRV